MNPQNAFDKPLARQLKTGLILTAVMGLALLSTAFIPKVKQLSPVKREEARPVHAPGTIQVVPRIVTGELSIVYLVHRAVSVHGVYADQAYRLFAAAVFLVFYSIRVLSSSRTVRVGLAAFSVLGAAGCLSDAVSFCVLGGVVDWIGVNGRSAFAPSDVCWCVAPLGTILIVAGGLLTFRAPAAAVEDTGSERPAAQAPSCRRTVAWSK